MKDIVGSDDAYYLRRLVDRVPSMLAYWDRDLICRFANAAYERWFGVDPNDLIGTPLRALLGAELFAKNEPYIRGALAGIEQVFERIVPGPGGEQRQSQAHYLPDIVDGVVVGFIVQVYEITHFKEKENRLHEIAHRDHLTGVLNRAGFEQKLEASLRGTDVPPMALFYIDLDDFKFINDLHGHPVGDRVLMIFAQRLVNVVRPTDVVARLGGDEFAVALMDVKDRDNALAVADKVLACAQERFHVGELLLDVGASIGVSYRTTAEMDWRQLVEQADNNLMAAKAAGKGRHAGSPG